MDRSKDYEAFFNQAKKYKSTKSVDWQQVRIQASIAAMQAILGNDTRYKEAVDSWEEDHSFLEAVAKDACIYADELVEELKTRVK